ncbi:MAG TPA: hypothetical protein VM934_18290 [Pyrinomonadaceae bacterium]|nr:hypothetical protein [Pyrinomonadaceae bacterium]
MKRRIIIALLLIVAAAFIGRQMQGTKSVSERGGGRSETRESFRLEPGASVEVRGINGSLEITTTETDTADVHIVGTAGSREELDGQKVIVEHTPSSLLVRTENSGNWWSWFRGGGARQRVSLALPRSIELTARGVNGPVKVGEVDGSVEMAGINGRVEVSQVSGHSAFHGNNGNVSVGVGLLDGQGLEVHGNNGVVEIRVPDGLNADVDVEGLNGSVALNIPGVTMQERQSRSSMRARLGSGGAPVNIRGVNGSVRFESIAPAVVR